MSRADFLFILTNVAQMVEKLKMTNPTKMTSDTQSCLQFHYVAEMQIIDKLCFFLKTIFTKVVSL